MLKEITVKGLSSNKELMKIELDSNLDTNLLDLLRNHNIAIASSCFGEGVCKKCLISEDIISCQVKVKDFIKISEKYNNIITINYL